MKTTRSILTVVMMVAAISLSPGAARAATVQVDVGRTDQPLLQSGWQEWNFSSSSGIINQSKTFTYADATDGTLDANLSTTTSGQGRNYGLSKILDPGNLTIPNVWADQAFFNNNASGSMTLTLNDLKAGTYRFTSYHYANNLSDDSSNNDEGTASVFVNSVDTAQHVTFISGLQSSVSGGGGIETADLEAFGTLTTTFTVPADNSPVAIKYANLTGGDTFGINGFQLVSPPSPPPPTPSELKIDVGRTGQSQVQSGWQEWDFTGTSGNIIQSKQFPFAATTDGTLDATLTTTTSGEGRNYGLSNVTDPGNLTLPDVWADQVYFNNNASGSMTLTLEDLKAGTYSFTSYHYANNLSDSSSNNDEGTASVFLNGVDTGLDVTFISGLLSTVSGGGKPSSADLDAFGTLSFEITVPNDGDTVTILFNNLAGGDTFGLNGFELAPLTPEGEIPEPATMALLGLAACGLGGYIRRRRARRDI